MPPLTNVVKATYPSGIDAGDLAFDELLESLVGDEVYFGAGTLSDADIETYLSDQATITSTLASNFESLGELAEKPSKADSKVDVLKTRNYVVPGKRSTSVEVTLSGISNLQKAFLESASFQNETYTLIMLNRDHDRMVIYNGMRWITSWSGEVDGVFTVVLASEFGGTTNAKIKVYKDIPATGA